MRIPEITQHMHEELALRWHLLEYKGGVFWIRRQDTAGFQCSWDKGLNEQTGKPAERIVEHRRRAGDALLAVKKQIDRKYPSPKPAQEAGQP